MRIKFLLLLFLIPSLSFSQSIIYSDPVNIRYPYIIGEVNQNIFFYQRDKLSIVVYDKDMKFKTMSELTFLPAADITSINFITYSNYCTVIFQTIENDVHYCKAAKIDDLGRLIEDVKVIDSCNVDIFNNDETYTVAVSENKKYILFSRSLWGIKEDKLQMDQLVVDEKLTVKKSDYFIPFKWGEQLVSSATVDNKGNVIFLAWNIMRSKKTNLILYKSSLENSDLLIKEYSINSYGIKQPYLILNNLAEKYYVCGMYKNKKDNTEGLFSLMLNSDLTEGSKIYASSFAGAIRALADKSEPYKMALNDYTLSQIILRKDGGFILAAGMNKVNDTYTSSPFLTDEHIFTSHEMYTSPRYFYSNRSRNVEHRRSSKLDTYNSAYRTGNVLFFSFDSNNQFLKAVSMSSNTLQNPFIYYRIINLGTRIVIMYNEVDKTKKILLSSSSMMGDGALVVNPLLRSLDKGYEFQVSSGCQINDNTVIIPCIKKDQLSFAKITFE